jgi:hypothetical protein
VQRSFWDGRGGGGEGWFAEPLAALPEGDCLNSLCAETGEAIVVVPVLAVLRLDKEGTLGGVSIEEREARSPRVRMLEGFRGGSCCEREFEGKIG